jgi:hypothetical protein
MSKYFNQSQESKSQIHKSLFLESIIIDLSANKGASTNLQIIGLQSSGVVYSTVVGKQPVATAKHRNNKYVRN